MRPVAYEGEPSALRGNVMLLAVTVPPLKRTTPPAVLVVSMVLKVAVPESTYTPAADPGVTLTLPVAEN